MEEKDSLTKYYRRSVSDGSCDGRKVNGGEGTDDNVFKKASLG